MERANTQHNHAASSSNIRITVKTIDNRTHVVALPANSTIFELKLRIKGQLGIDVEDIHLLYKGSALLDNHTLAFYNIKNENVINLIATSSGPRAFPSSNRPLSRNSQQNNENEIVTNILKTLTDTAINRRDQRLKALQCRAMGFPVLEKESLEVIKQNLLTVEQMFASREDQGILASKNSSVYPFNVDNRKFFLGQWLDVKDTIDQWLEAEVIDVQDSLIRVHYNGWGARWDEWINMSSQRIAFFRNKTVQPYNTFYLSPVPQSRLSGDATNLEAPNNDKNAILKRTCAALEETSVSLKNFNDLSTQINKVEQGKLAEISAHPISNKKTPKIKYARTVKGIQDNKSHLSLKFNEKEISLKPTIDDSKSLRLPNHSPLENELWQKRDSIIENSPRSTKSIKSQLSSNYIFYNNEPVYEEENEIIEEDLHREISSEFADDEGSFKTDKGCEFSFAKKKTTSLHRGESNLDQIIALKAAQLAPLLDRVGRALIDLAPHVASIGQEEFGATSEDVGRAIIQPSVLGIFNRFMYEALGNSNQEFVSSNNLIFKHPVKFQIPVMLTPGEIINTVNPSPPIFNDNFIDLNLHAVVRNERRGSSLLVQDKATQTD